MIEKTRISIPDMSGVPRYTRIEAMCRRLGAIPKSHKEARERGRQKVLALLRQATLEDRDREAIAGYFRGDFDRKREDGRPEDLDQQGWNFRMKKEVNAFVEATGCSTEKAIAHVFESQKIDDPDAKQYVELLNFIKRGDWKKKKRPHE